MVKNIYIFKGLSANFASYMGEVKRINLILFLVKSLQNHRFSDDFWENNSQ